MCCWTSFSYNAAATIKLKKEDATYPNLYAATLLEYLELLSTVLCLLVLAS